MARTMQIQRKPYPRKHIYSRQLLMPFAIALLNTASTSTTGVPPTLIRRPCLPIVWNLNCAPVTTWNFHDQNSHRPHHQTPLHRRLMKSDTQHQDYTIIFIPH
uniref:Secreted protein n=1 Tax=Acrobeloides nanus TaxID=290746 RepID=A0A914D3D3_9BILA